MSHENTDVPQPDSTRWFAIVLVRFAILAAAGLLAFSRFGFTDCWAEAAAAPTPKSAYSVAEIATAKRHDAYAALYAANLVAVGTVVKRDGPVAAFPGNTESHPEWILLPTEILYQNPSFARRSGEYVLSGAVADADLKKRPYLYAHGFGGQQAHLGAASDELLKVAAIAAEQRRHHEAELLHQAKTNPASHPLFRAIRAGDNLATVDVVDDMAAGISIDRAGTVEEFGKRPEGDVQVVLLAANLRGTFPTDDSTFGHIRISRPLPKPLASQPLIVVWKLEAGNARAIHVETRHEATLRIAAAALKREFEHFSFVAAGAQHSSSRGSQGPSDDHH